MQVLIDLSIRCLFNADRAGKALLFRMIVDVNQHAEVLKNEASRLTRSNMNPANISRSAITIRMAI
jgi:hypothetical protein